ncbi:hypothetical protein P168DRAFT_269406 [Aspergillus campestris IBT 28561]|uniref:DUF3500 domain-containing protein n=1 Tax=Aspergillus campestris (strain IBT 28561) TaxID=1392248 RepID=A0A2I1D3K5_ASPC2|nr:uncharacterized protein P168DRAFT_269406 [Aspergillus campestris IBT 28561]PKY04457.1 hypothetical protein P168DRAFT_269406 [Aspergillus campestris IBT 28561]
MTHTTPTGEYRQYLPDLGLKRFQVMRTQDAHEYAHDFKTLAVPPWLHALYMHWLELLQEPFKGVTVDGNVRPGLFTLQDEGIPMQEIVDAVHAVEATLDDKQQQRLHYHIDSPEWRTWSNPEFLLSDKGLRLDEVSTGTRGAVMKVLQATLSPEGYDKAVKAMRINHFLGELVESPRVMNEFSYNFVIFGRPSTTRPWGWSFYGHHLCLNVFLYRGQLVASPWFTGAEPNEIDSGPHAGTRILQVEESLGLQLMQSLSPPLQEHARVYKQVHDPAMPPGRWNRDDQRHLCGAYRDNRVVPYEGITVSTFSEQQKTLLYDILEQYLLYLPARARQMKIDHIRQYEAETHFCWIGEFGNNDPFYYRIQSPVILAEFDHHSGVFLNNEEPKKFHIHTLLRTPNAGDYGSALRPLIPATEGLNGTEIKW